jgi:hypothetical protein
MINKRKKIKRDETESSDIIDINETEFQPSEVLIRNCYIDGPPSIEGYHL